MRATTSPCWLILLATAAACGRVAFSGPQVPDAPVGGPADGPGDTGDRPVDAAENALPGGMVLWLALDDDPSDGASDTAGGRTAACGPLCPQRVPARRGSGYRFAGTYLVVPFDTALAGSSSFTAAAWMNLDALPVGNYACPVNKPLGTGNYDTYALCIDPDGPKSLFYSADGGTDDYLFGAAAAVATGSWHHYAVTWDGATKRTYLDGALTSAHVAAIASDDAPIYIGVDWNTDAPAYPIQAVLDDVMVWSRALDDTEIAAVVAQ